MTLPAPNLDSRRFDDLVREARDRIPRYTPEWTNFNPSDPGMTLVNLHAWMTETILYQLNQVPDLNYVKFLDLLGVVPMPAQPARTQLTFTLNDLSKPDDALQIPVPLTTSVAVDDPDLPKDLTFETDRSLSAINAHIGAVLVHSAATTHSRKLVTRYDEGTEWLHGFAPFDAALTPDKSLYLGLLLRPIRSADAEDYAEDALPAGPLDLYFESAQVYDTVYDILENGTLDDGTLIEGPIARKCAAAKLPDVTPTLEWQLFTGGPGDTVPTDASDTGWARLSVSRDDTNGLSRSGHLVLEIPAGASALDPAELSEPFWQSFGEIRPPRDKQDLIDLLNLGTPDILAGLADFWETMGLNDPEDLDALAACAASPGDTAAKLASPTITLDPTVLTISDWIGINPAFAVDLPMEGDTYRPLYWLRVKINRPLLDTDPKPQTIYTIHLNTVGATQATTILEERLGRSNGRPAQSVKLAKTPVLISPATQSPELSLTVTEADNLPVTWTRVDDFYRSGPSDTHYTLDPQAGAILFGDGRRGRIPVAGARFIAARYRVGGGLIGNVGADKITKIKGLIRGVKSAINVRPSHDGTDAETLADVKLRAPHDLRSRDRAVSAEDFRDLAMRTPGVNLHRVFALARRAVKSVTSGEMIYEKDGAVTLVVLPNNDQAAPQPSEEQQRAICRWLEPRRLITTELHIIGPRYSDVTTLSARINVRDGHDLASVGDAIYARLLDFMHPIHGGTDGAGWPFGEAIYHGDLYDQMLAIPGVRRVTALRVALDGATAQTVNDYTNLPEGHLPVLRRDAIDMVLGYE